MTKLDVNPKKYQLVVNQLAKHSNAAVRSINPIAVLTETLDFLKVKTEEETKREHIWAKRDVLISALNAEKDTILKYFEYRFSERKATLEQFYQLLHRSADTGDGDSLQIALNGILGIVQDNPLKDLAEFKKNMSNPDFLIEL
jgi:hypothetical protein